MSDRVLISITDGVADVTFNRADKRNALDNAMFKAIAEAGEQLKSEPGVRAVVLSGDGASFCAGLDFSSFQAMAGGDGVTSEAARAEGSPGTMQGDRITHLGQQVCWVWQELEVPVIAAVQSDAVTSPAVGLGWYRPEEVCTSFGWLMSYSLSGVWHPLDQLSIGWKRATVKYWRSDPQQQRAKVRRTEK